MLVLLLACRSAPVDPVSLPSPTVTWSPLVSTVPVVSWSAPAGSSEHTVEYGLDGAFDLVTPATSSSSLALLGLKGGRTYAVRAVSQTSSGRAESKPVTIEVPPPPSDLPLLVVEHRDPASEAARGYILSTTTTWAGGTDATTYVVIWDGDGDPVWWQASPAGHITVSPSFGTTQGTILWDDYDITDTERLATAVQMAIDGSEGVSVPLLKGHHAVIEPEPGVLAWIAHDVREAAQPGAWITADRVYEAPLDDTSSPREVVNLYDALYGGTYTAQCVHPSTPLPFGDIFPVYEWSHANSLVYLPERDAYLVYLRWVDTALLVDRGTGDIVWVMGGPYGEFVSESGAPLHVDAAHTLLSHAHVSQAWDGGLVAFDNGSHRVPPVSSVLEIAWDEGERTATEVFRWEDDGEFSAILGDVRKLPSGSYLAAWAVTGVLTEVDAAGELLWRARTEPERDVGRIQWAASLYR